MVSLFFMYKKYKSLCYFFIKYKIFFFSLRSPRFCVSLFSAV